MPKSNRGGKSRSTASQKESLGTQIVRQPKSFTESINGIGTDKELQIHTDAFGQGTVVEIIGTLDNGNEITFWQSKILKGTDEDVEIVKKMYRHAQEDLKYYKEVGYGGAR